MAWTTIDEYLATLPDDKRAALERLRAQIRAAAPDATETIAYGIPGFRIDGRYLLGFGATKDDCSFYTGGEPRTVHADELVGYRLSKGTIGFKPDKPIPDELVTRIVRERVAERRPRDR